MTREGTHRAPPPLPRRPMPVEPVPVEPLTPDYGNRADERPPRAVTLMGIGSIVVASANVMVDLGSLGLLLILLIGTWMGQGIFAWAHPGLNDQPVVAAMAQTAGELVLGVYLMVVGIMVLCKSRHAWALHRFWLVLRAGLGVTAFLTWRWFAQEFPTWATQSDFGWMTTVSYVMAGIYPVALVFILCRRDVREYYGRIKA